MTNLKYCQLVLNKYIDNADVDTLYKVDFLMREVAFTSDELSPQMEEFALALRKLVAGWIVGKSKGKKGIL